MFASNGILFNHESPLRGETFVTKIISALVKISLNRQKLYLGNLYARRDWGHAKENTSAKKPDDFVIDWKKYNYKTIC